MLAALVAMFDVLFFTILVRSLGLWVLVTIRLLGCRLHVPLLSVSRALLGRVLCMIRLFDIPFVLNIRSGWPRLKANRPATLIRVETGCSLTVCRCCRS